MIEIKKQGDTCLLVSLNSDLKMENAEIFYRNIREIWANKSVVLDLTRVDFIDSSGIGILLKMVEALAPEGRQIYLFNPNKGIRAVLKLSGIMKILPVMDEPELDKHFSGQ